MSEQSNYPTSNSGSEYFNENICRTFIQPVTTSIAALSGASRDLNPNEGDGWPCSEVLIRNLTGVVVKVWDKGYHDDAGTPASGNHFYWQLEDNDEVTIRGITNVNQVSAALVTGAAKNDLFIRAQYYSSNPIR